MRCRSPHAHHVSSRRPRFRSALPVATPLYVTVRAHNPAGLHSVTVSNSFVVDVTPPEVVTVPYFLSLQNGSKSERQWDRSVLLLAWQFRDLDSPVVSHVVNVVSQQRGRLITEPVILGADTKLMVTSTGQQSRLAMLLGSVRQVTSSRLFVDSTPPFQGTFRSPLTWKFENVTGGVMAAVVNVTWQDFTDPESAVVSYYVIAGRACNGEELSNGPVTVVHDNGQTYSISRLSCRAASCQNDVIFLGVLAENHVGLKSEMVRNSV
ncbi:hypothetical protein C0Q70_12629 [Pomacea canaliculata]|uniref:Uncharacterized protein n=1 Tax=Pomacea canaliculata TaxID=400727 RepID=A0A2T7P230_POMCA|nr:hypothetical protein C0Q70_12629 [Pomacea canaliculata]